MRLHDRNSIRYAAQRAAEQRSETFDGICWEVLDAERLVRCKIQGSNDYVLAKWPTNWQTRPPWLRPGQSVRLLHREGIRGYIEATGFGLTIPTPIAGSTAPTPERPGNAILSGLQLYQRPAGASMLVWVSMGTARFDGDVVASLGQVCTDEVNMTDGLTIGQIAWAGILEAPESGRHLLIDWSIGETGFVKKYEGIEFTIAPVYPNVPAGELRCARLLLSGGMTEITTADIAEVWTEPVASILDLSAEDTSGGQKTQYDVTCTVKDQYGNDITSSFGWRIECTVEDGDGLLTPHLTVGMGESGTTVERLTVWNEAAAVFRYDKGATQDYAVVSAYLKNGDASLSGSIYLAIVQD